MVGRCAGPVGVVVEDDVVVVATSDDGRAEDSTADDASAEGEATEDTASEDGATEETGDEAFALEASAELEGSWACQFLLSGKAILESRAANIALGSPGVG
jgi:hypothetical protein